MRIVLNNLNDVLAVATMTKCSDVTENADTVVMGEPVMVNPNSHAAVQNVLKHISDGSRKWVLWGAMAYLMCLVNDIIDTHPDLQHVIILPGPGHIEINMVRAMFKLRGIISIYTGTQLRTT